MHVWAGHICIALDGPVPCAPLVVCPPPDPVIPSLLTVRVDVELAQGRGWGGHEYRHSGQIGGQRWTASAPVWWEAEGRGLEEVHCRIWTDGPGGPRLAVRSLLRFLVAEVAVRTGGLAVHAAAVSRPEGAVVLLAPSGGGKTTLACTFGRDAVLADDFCLISPVGDRFRVPVSPLPGREGLVPTGRPAWLWRVAQVVKADEVAFAPLPRAEAVRAVLGSSILFSRDKGALDALLGTAIRLLTETVVGRLWATLEHEPWGVM